MDRVREPELMDGTEQAAAYAAADFAAVNAGIVANFRARFPSFDRGTIVDLGCGPADIAIRLAQALPRVRIVAVDGSATMLAHARRAVDAMRLADRVDLVHSLLPAPQHLSGPFDAVISNSLLHHFHEPMGLWLEIKRIARPGAATLIVDLMRPDTPERARDIVASYAGSEPRILQTDFYNSLLAAFTIDEVRAQLRAAGLDDALTVEPASDRHLNVFGVRP